MKAFSTGVKFMTNSMRVSKINGFQKVVFRSQSTTTMRCKSQVIDKIDYRSDTVTKPTDEMIAYMLECEVGDDYMLEDPTTKLLEDKVAKLFGKEAGLFVPSGTMSNQLAVRLHINEPTTQVLLDKNAHIYQYELGGVAEHCGVSCKTVTPSNGKFMTKEDVEAECCLENNWLFPITKLICLENTMSGSVYPFEDMKEISDFAREKGLKMHLDGARVWNASIKTGISLEEYGELFDTVSACLSKGVGAPMGTVLVGSEEDMYKARRYRKLYGGGLRQIGMMAGCAMYGIDHIWPLMEKDHANASLLAKELEKLGFEMAREVETNMVVADSTNCNKDWSEMAPLLKEKGIIISPDGYTKNKIARMVLHHQITTEDVEFTIQEIAKILSN